MAQSKSIRKLESGFRVEERRQVPEAVLAQGLGLYEKGRYVDAFKEVSQAGPLQAWTGGDALAFGFRLAGNVGATRLAALLISRGMREEPANEHVAVHYGYYLQYRRGLLPAWRHARHVEGRPGISESSRADLLALRGSIAGHYRDFETAWKLWNEAMALSPQNPWMGVEKAGILLSQEKRTESLAALDEALVLRSWYRPAVQQKARVLHLLGRWDEAIEFLSESLNHIQSYAVAMQLMNLKREVDDHAGMEELAETAERLAVMLEPSEKEWFQARRADILYLKGDYEAAARAAESVSGEYYPAFATRLRSPEVGPRRVRLPFEFVHQKQNTCAPATLAAVAHFWSREITMEQITDAICYDGTYDYSERSWCEANGFSVREFSVTQAAARALIDGGVPFIISTVDVGSAHAQAVIGYDDLRETLFIQDPSEPHYREVPAQEFLEGYRLMGPRGLALVPPEKAEWLAGLDLPEQLLYEWNFRFNLALGGYDRDGAMAALQEMEKLDAAHRLVLLAHLSLAGFDGNEVMRAESIDRLLALFPDDPRLLNWKVLTLRTLGRRDERLVTLRHAAVLDAMHPVLLRELGVELIEDARDWKEARRCLWKAHAAMPGDATLLIRLADLLHRSRQEEGEEILHYYRFAAAASDKVEGYAQLWFGYAVSQGRTEEALNWLKRRMHEYGSKSGGPAITLLQALDMLGRPEMVEVMREAVARRPEDGELLLQMTRLEARLGAFAEAGSLLERARGKTFPGAWLRTQAALLRRQGDLAAELEVWKDILVKEPLALDAHEALARELAATRGAHAAVEHLETVCSQFPHHYGLGQLFAGWLREADLSKTAAQVQRMIEFHPSDPWGYRELALIRREMGQPHAALESARKAETVAPDHPSSHAILGMMLDANGLDVQAAQSYRQAIRLDVNYSGAFDGLLQTVLGTERQRQELDFIRSEMIRQVLNGNGLHAYRGHAFTILAPAELLAQLNEIWQARPDLWEAWSVLIAQQLDSGPLQQTEAVKLAQEAVERFPLIPGAWGDLATALRLTGDKEAAIQTMEKAVQLNPDWAQGWKQLAEFQDDAGHGREAVGTLRKSLIRLPLDMSLRAALATLLWAVDEREEAWNLAHRAAQGDPGQDWAWNCMRVWAGPLQRHEDLIAFARALTAQRPDEARSWHVLARLLPIEKITEIIEALNRAIVLNPRLIDAYDYRAEALARLGRLDEAEASLKREPFTKPELTPFTLRGRLAWLRAVRRDLHGAMTQMREVLDTHRDYFWGWEMMSTWAEQREDLPEWRKAAAEMIRLNPRAALPYCTAADAELYGKQREKGIRYLQQALQVDPGSPYAAHRLLGVHWEKAEVAAMKAAAEPLSRDGSTGVIRQVYLMLAAAHEGETATVRAMLHDLAVHPDMMGPLLQLILDYFQNRKRQYNTVLDEVLQIVIKENTIGPAFAILWTQRECQKRQWHVWHQLSAWLPRLGSRLDPAIGVYLDTIGDARLADPHVVNFLQKSGSELRQRGELWGKAGFALASSNAFRACVDWLSPDYKRPDAEGWMLSNLAMSLRCIRQPARAAEVSQHAVEQGIRDHTWQMHVAIAVLGFANAGAYDEARMLLNREDLEGATVDSRLLALTARALCDVMPLSAAQGKPRFKQFLGASKQMIGGQALSAETRRDYDDAVEKMRAHTGVTIMPWQKVKPGQPAQSGGGGVSRVAIWIGVVILIQSLRFCNQGPSSLPSSSSGSFRNPPVDVKNFQDRLNQMPPQPDVIVPGGSNPFSLREDVFPTLKLKPLPSGELTPVPKRD